MNGKRFGKGKEFGFDYSTFEGEFLNGYKIEGKGYDQHGKLDFVLERNGKGKVYYSDGNLEFEGEYLKGEKMEKESIIIEMVN